ncbi:MAG TPA: hypothetical protein VHE77_18085 [Dongiaceae bacterium]|nr:hypothetical protein [Dongiaceae bacterium]
MIAATLLLAATAGADAQSTAGQAEPPASVQAVSYAPIAPGAQFETQMNNDTELDQEALDLVNQALVGRGYSVDTAGSLVMVVETDLVRGQKQDDPLGQAYADNNGAKVQARLFSTSQNSLLNPQQPIGSADRLFRISLSVYDRASGLYVWRGSVMRNDPDLDVNKASNEMVAALIATLGRTVHPAPAQ